MIAARRRARSRTARARIGSQAIAALRRLRMTGAEIALCLGMPLSTVSAVLERIGLGKLSRLEPPEPPNRYERARPGELVHVDVKKLGVINGAGHRVNGRRASQNATRRGRRQGKAPGWEFVHVCVDDATRLAYVEVLARRTGRDRRGVSAARGRVLRQPRDHRAAGDERQRRLLPLDASTRSPAGCSGCATCAPGPTGRARMGKRSDSSARCSAAGPTARSTAPAPNAPPPLTAGYGPTTIAAHTDPCATSRPQPAYAS